MPPEPPPWTGSSRPQRSLNETSALTDRERCKAWQRWLDTGGVPNRRYGELLPANYALPIKARVLPVSSVTRDFAIVTVFLPVAGRVGFTGVPCTMNLQHTGALGLAMGCDFIPGWERVPCTEELEPMPVQSDLACVLWCGANKTKPQFLQKGDGAFGTIV